MTKLNPEDVESFHWTGVMLESDPPHYEIVYIMKNGERITEYYISDGSGDLITALEGQGFKHVDVLYN